MATAGRLRLGLGLGLASGDVLLDGPAAGVADPVGAAEAAASPGAVDGEGVGEGLAVAVVDDGVGLGVAESGDCVGTAAALEVAALPGVVGELDGVVVHPATTPAHTRAARASFGRLTSSG